MDNQNLKAHISILGYALFIVINATQVWGGVFPFLPEDFQTHAVTLAFYLSQSLSFFAAYVASTIGSYFLPKETRRLLVTLCCALIFLGSACIIGAIYVPQATLPLVVAGGILLGTGTAAGFMLWQRYFSSLSSQACNYRLLAGTGASAALYLLLTLVPIALTAFLVPLVLLPLFGLCLNLSLREIDLEQPMFEDVPQEHPKVYVHLLQSLWRGAICVGTLGFCSGLARAVAALSKGVVDALNEISMIGMLIAAVVLLVLWLFTSMRFNIGNVFRFIYPILLTALLVLPLLADDGISLFAGGTYMVFTFMTLVMMMQSAQISRDRGTNPVFTYGVYGSVAFGMQGLGFLIGWFVGEFTQDFLLSTIAGYVLGMGILIIAWPYLSGKPRVATAIESIEFYGLMQKRKKHEGEKNALESANQAAGLVSEIATAEVEGSKANANKESAATAARTDIVPLLPLASKVEENLDSFVLNKAFAEQGYVIKDRLSKNCVALGAQYALSTRETEVMELIARGLAVSAISEALFISENTVRTHSKHIYTKLDIHSKQELSSMLNNMQG